MSENTNTKTEHIQYGDTVEKVFNKMNNAFDRVDESIEKADNVDKALLDAKTNGVTGETHETLGGRLDADSQLIKDLDEKVKEDVSSLKGNVDKTVQAINDRVNNLITQNNPTEGNSELQDIRLGADGVTYPSAGEAVRQQLSFIIKLLKELQGSASISMQLKNALLNCFSNVAWSNENGQVYYNELKKAFELIKTMSLLYGGSQVIVKGTNIYSDMGGSSIASGNSSGKIFASDTFREDSVVKVTLIPSTNVWNPSYIGITKTDEWEHQFSTSSTGYIYNATKFNMMAVDMEYPATLNVKAGYQVIFLVGGENTAEPEIEVVEKVEE